LVICRHSEGVHGQKKLGAPALGYPRTHPQHRFVFVVKVVSQLSFFTSSMQNAVNRISNVL